MAAKKNKATTKKVAKKKATKKTPVSKAGTKKTPAQKAAKKTVTDKVSARKSKTTAKSTSVKTRSKASSVDGILKRFQKERVAQESKLVSVRGQIKDLTNKIQAYQKQIVKLKSQQLDTENSICTLDIRRDQEIAGLLASLGINLDSIASAGDMTSKKKVDKPTPLFDAAQAGEAEDATTPDGKADDAKPATSDKPKVEILIADKK